MISFVIFKTPERYWSLLITLGAIVVFLLIGFAIKSWQFGKFLLRREIQLQRILDVYNSGPLGRRHCVAKSGVYGSNLRLIFTVSPLNSSESLAQAEKFYPW